MKTNQHYFFKNNVAKSVVLAVCLLNAGEIWANDPIKSNPADTISIPQVQVVGQDERKIFKNIPGTVNVITSKEIKEIAPLSASDVLRKVPGLHINDEDPAALRLNIGVRGLNPQRSTRVLVLEDGIPVTLNPYGEPQMYYSPMIDRMDGVEVLKSSGQLLFGPQTIGGVVNFVTPNPPESMTNRIKLNAGGGGFFSGYASHGNSVGNAGYIVNYLHKRADNLGPLKFAVNDANAKFNFNISDRSQLGFKVGFYNEESNSTYIGLTQAMYDNNSEWDQQTLAPHDLMLLDKYSASVTHNYKISENVQLQTNAFVYYIRRNWRRQDFDRANDPARTYERIVGDGADGASIFFRETSRWRNRQYVVKGVEPRFDIRHDLFNVSNTLKTGVRVLWETAYEQAIRTTLPDAFNGANGETEERRGFATSAYAVNEFQFTEKFSANVGLRIENYQMEREIFNVAANNNSNVTHDRSVFAFIPGAGLNYNAKENITLFAGVHKGFAPPVLKSALNVDGVVDEIDKEESVNYDLGARFSVGNYLSFTPSLFYIDFQNQVIPVTLATAGSGFANGGKSKHLGSEFGVDFDLAKYLGSANSFLIGGTFTYTDARFAGDGITESDQGEAVESVKDNYLPYAPKIMFNNYVSLNLVNGFGFRISGNYVGKQYSESTNLETPVANGASGAIDARYILDGNLFYTLKNKYTFNVSARNITNERAILTRHAQGIRVVLDRFITAGIDISF